MAHVLLEAFPELVALAVLAAWVLGREVLDDELVVFYRERLAFATRREARRAVDDDGHAYHRCIGAFQDTQEAAERSDATTGSGEGETGLSNPAAVATRSV